MIALGMIAVVAGALRLAASMLADAKLRRDALCWVVAGTFVAVAAL